MRRTIWGLCTTRAGASRKTTLKSLSGSDWPLSRGTPMRRAIWGSCTTKAKAFLKTMSEHINGLTWQQARMLTAAIGLLAGAIAALSDSLDVNVSIVIILLSGAMLLGEWFRSFRS